MKAGTLVRPPRYLSQRYVLRSEPDGRNTRRTWGSGQIAIVLETTHVPQRGYFHRILTSAGDVGWVQMLWVAEVE